MFDREDILLYSIRFCTITLQPYFDTSCVYYTKNLEEVEDPFVISEDYKGISPEYQKYLNDNNSIIIEISINQIDPESQFVEDNVENMFENHRTGRIMILSEEFMKTQSHKFGDGENIIALGIQQFSAVHDEARKFGRSKS